MGRVEAVCACRRREGTSSPFIFAKYSRRMYIIMSTTNKSNKHLNQFNSSSSSTTTAKHTQEKGNRAHARGSHNTPPRLPPAQTERTSFHSFHHFHRSRKFSSAKLLPCLACSRIECRTNKQRNVHICRRHLRTLCPLPHHLRIRKSAPIHLSLTGLSFPRHFPLTEQ